MSFIPRLPCSPGLTHLCPGQVRGTWDEQKVLPKNQMPKRGEPIDPAKCGPAAVQRLSGEVIP